MVKKRLGGSPKYSRKDVLELKAIFDKHDDDGSGEVSIAEIAKGFKGLGLGTEGRDAFQALDLNKDGKVSFKEYLMVYYPYASPNEVSIMNEWAFPKAQDEGPRPELPLTEEQTAELRDIFVLYDKNKNGVLERHEVVNAVSACGYESEEIEEMFESADMDHDNILSFPEFMALLKKSYQA